MNYNTLRAAILVALLALVGSPIFFGRPSGEAGEIERKASQTAIAETGGQDIFATDIEIATDGIIRAWVGVDTGGIISIVIKDANGNVLDVLSFKGVAAITANGGYTFDWAARAGLKYNYRTDTSADVTIYVDLVTN